MKIKCYCALMSLFMAFMIFTATGFAEILPGVFTVSPMAGGFVFDKALDLDEQNSPDQYSLGLGYNIDENWAIEGLFGYMQPKTQVGNNDIDVYRYELDALFHLLPENKLVPYLAGGIGAITYDPEIGGKDTNALLNVGGGFKLFLDPSFAIRADIRKMMAIDDFADDGKDDHWAYSIGATLAFGGKKKPVPVAAPEPMDSDGDGVIDCQDKCPNTPKGCPVDAAGCPLDSDGDGLIDCQDKCPNTPKGASVDDRGCWVISASVLFDFDKSDLKPSAKEELDKIYLVLEQNTGLKVEIQGHTCSMGPTDYNQKLSERRAESVKAYLVEKGVSQEILSTIGYGEEQPIAPNDTKEGRAKNRRVRFKPLQ